MALKMLYRGPSTRLETLIEKIQQNKDSSPDIDSSNTSPSYSPSLPDMASTPNFEVDNILSINNNNKITAKQHHHHHQQQQQQYHHSEHSLGENGGINENILPERDEKHDEETGTTPAMKGAQRISSETGVAYSPINATIKVSSRVHSEQPTMTTAKSKGEGSRLGKYAKINGTTSQLPSNATNNNVEGSYHCQFCDKSFPRLGYLKKHEQSHAEHMPFKCEYCARLFKHKRSRDRHTKLHTGDRRYRCPHCESAFSRSDHLKIHMKTHDNQKPFQCTVCNRGYNTAAALTSHMQSHKKQAALQRNSTLNYSPRSTGSASSSNSLYKRKYSPHIDQRDTPSQSSLLAVNAKRFAYHSNNTSILYCIYCTKNDFENLEQLHSHVQQMHAIVLREAAASPFSGISPSLHLTCEFCTMKFPSISSMFQHIRSMHIDRIGNPATYMEHIGRRSTGFADANDNYRRKSSENFVHPLEYSKPEENHLKHESNTSKGEHDTTGKNLNEQAKHLQNGDVKQDDLPTDLSNKKSESKLSEKREDSNEVNHSPNNSPIDSYVNRKRLQKTTPDFTNTSPDPLRCSQCTLILPNIEAFRDHLRNHLVRGELKNFVCFQCGLTFTNQNEYELHVSSHFLISTTEYTCSFGCNKHFVNAESMQKHLFDAHAQNVWKCGICYEIFESKMAIQIHFAMTHSNKEDSFRCSACMEAFETENEFKNHVRTQHSLMLSLPNLQCSLCRTVCSSELEMHFHMATHSRQGVAFRCTLCPEAFHIEFLLERHMQTHHCLPEKDSLGPYKIDNLNNNMFDYSYAAKKLYPFSTGAGPTKLFDSLNIPSSSSSPASLKLPPPLYELYDNIGKTFSQHTHTLSKHFSNISKSFSEHLDQSQQFSKPFAEHSPEIPSFLNLYKSEYASKSFLRSNPLVFMPPTSTADQHYNEKKASADTPLACNVCNICDRKDFQSELEMLTHQKITHNMKTGVSLNCAYCNDNFRSRNELENHMKTVHTGGKHKCLICDEIFPSADILAEHKLNHSKVGVQGKCTYCSANLPDIQGFKSHMAEHGNVELPVQCICCRQTLSSQFEIDLHAKFHVSSSSSDGEERNCALCLVALPPKYGSKVCKKCYEKHNNHNKHAAYSLSKEIDLTVKETILKSNIEPLPDHHCNLCKKPFSTATELEEHLIEHSFRGCEERGYNCYICSAIFTLPSGLHQHMIEHGPSYRPYDCNLCAKKFYFRAELENHLIDHESGRISTTPVQTPLDVHANTSNGIKREQNQMIDSNEDSDSEKDINPDTNIKSECQQYSTETNAEEDDEYIEVEQIGENISVNGEMNNGNRLKSPEIDDQRETSCEKDCLSDEI
ncbi:zinc finger protein 423 homolog isoform X2 [Sitodiplosis mosellana]|uniref:zinc finger protein 423 homolog isoform X2 n=1 Tax=Sitodiplosis mosellana TaxID=263140 RepID=UPI002443DA3E|nr:zinc finger protein 423 homolog isoform X2 [Sitodiplosis mosellana]